MMSVPMHRAQSRDRTAKRQKWRLRRRPNSTTMLEFTPDDTHHMCGGKRGGSGQGGGEDNGLHGYGLVLGWFREGGASGWLLADTSRFGFASSKRSACIFFSLLSLVAPISDNEFAKGGEGEIDDVENIIVNKYAKET